MEIEVVEFYVSNRDDKKQTLNGTLHVYLVDLQIDVRGIKVLREKNSWRFNLPNARAVDEEGKIVWYPLFSFTDRIKNTALLSQIRSKGREFVEKKLFSQELACQEK